MTVKQLWNRILALGLAALPLCAGLWTAASWLYGTHAFLSAEAMQTRQTLRTYEAMLQRRPEIESAMARSWHNARNYYWSGSSEDIATTDLQAQLRNVIDAAGSKVRDVETLPSTETDGHTALNLRVTLDASATELLETLYSLESNRPYLFLNQLHVHPPERQTRPARSTESLLQVTLDVRGYLEP